ncbi:MAG: hypothetical protein QGG97_02320 [Flavobacteriales bacterium]|jgi:hypothetical protein|nr:hypothetical protein [Flavobacteriales bacterium]|tara:strand:- start:444 stop:1085 length:642 start_codon:yes stop_codon:yes gene_type:complete
MSSTATSKVDICNLAMDHMGGGIIVNIDTPTTEQEIKCARWYDVTRRALLRAHPWGFAKARAAISRDTTDPTHSWADAYNLPSTLVRLNFIGDDSIMDYKGKYVLEGKQLLLDNSGATSINIGYTVDETDVTKFDSLFIDLLAVEIAWRVSFAFNLKPSLKKELREARIELRGEAKAVNSQERPPIRIQRSKLREARQRMTSNVAGTDTIFDS